MKKLRNLSVFLVLAVAFLFTGCANQFTQVLAETDKAIKGAKEKKADQLCHFEFDQVRKMRSKADDLFWKCQTKDAIELAKKATAKANALCPQHTHPLEKHDHPMAAHDHDKDSDGDGCLDSIDKCPTDPEDKDGFEDNDCCSDPDNDKDGILDVSDKCPNVPETFNGYQDEDGCPDTKPAPPSLRGVNFENDKDVLTAEAKGILDSVASYFTELPNQRVYINGHTDDRASNAYNQKLSEARAQAVKNYFVTKHGVSPSRMIPRGYGEDSPVATNSTAEGRAMNRRVEIVPTN